MKRLILDVDDTISYNVNDDYSHAKVNKELVDMIREYKDQGFEIVLSTSRNMRTYSGNIGKINAKTLPKLIKWLNENEVPYDEIYTGKPWCGFEGFYVDDKAIRPREFVENSYDEILKILERDKLEPDS